MATYNEYEDKEALIENPSIPDINKVKADDMNYIKYNLPHISNEVDEDYRVNFLYSKNLFDLNNIVSEKGLSADNSTYDQASRSYLDYTEVKENTTYMIGDLTWKVLIFLNSNKQVISSKNSDNDTPPFTTPANCKYIRISFDNSASWQSGKIQEGTTTFVPSIYVDNEMLVSKNVYSTGEVVIGEWLGKPLYRKVFKKTDLTTGDNTITTGLDIDDLVRLDCNLYRTNGIWHSLTFANSVNQNATMSITYMAGTANQITINIGSAITNASKAYVILEYTKTTD